MLAINVLIPNQMVGRSGGFYYHYAFSLLALTLWRPLLPYMGTVIKHPVPDWVKSSFAL